MCETAVESHPFGFAQGAGSFRKVREKDGAPLFRVSV
jgi:hypothetical protein